MNRLVAALLFLLSLVPLQALADGTPSRTMTAAEAKAYKNAAQTLYKAAPPAPRGYIRSVKPSLEENLKTSSVDDYATNISGCVFKFSYKATDELKNAASATMMQENMQDAAADPALQEEQKRLQKERKAARRSGSKDALALIEAQLAEVKKKIKAEEDQKLAANLADPQAYMKRLQARQPVDNMNLEMGVNAPFVDLDNFRTFAPAAADPSGRILVSKGRNGKFGVVRYFGNYTIEESGFQSRLAFKSAPNTVHTRPQVVYAFISTDENGAAFAVELLKKLDAAALGAMVE